MELQFRQETENELAVATPKTTTSTTEKSFKTKQIIQNTNLN